MLCNGSFIFTPWSLSDVEWQFCEFDLFILWSLYICTVNMWLGSYKGRVTHLSCFHYNRGTVVLVIEQISWGRELNFEDTHTHTQPSLVRRWWHHHRESLHQLSSDITRTRKCARARVCHLWTMCHIWTFRFSTCPHHTYLICLPS